MIITTIPTNLDFPNRGVLERDDFVLAQETAQGLLAGAYTTALNQYATELNDTEADINLKWEQVQSQAVVGSYSQAYIDATFTPKILNTQADKTTPVDADLIPLSDSASSFGLKKLSWANIKATLKTYFDTLYIALSGNQSVDGIKTFSSSPIVPTQTAQDNSTKVATTAYVDGKMVMATAVNSTSGTSIDFTGIPSWVKRITVMFNGVSTNGVNIVQVQLGDSGGVETTGYNTTSSVQTNTLTNIATYTSGFVIVLNITATTSFQGRTVFTNINSNEWIGQGSISSRNGDSINNTVGSKTLSGVLDRIRITTVNGTDTFDAGQINIMYEG